MRSQVTSRSDAHSGAGHVLSSLGIRLNVPAAPMRPAGGALVSTSGHSGWCCSIPGRAVLAVCLWCVCLYSCAARRLALAQGVMQAASSLWQKRRCVCTSTVAMHNFRAGGCVGQCSLPCGLPGMQSHHAWGCATHLQPVEGGQLVLWCNLLYTFTT
jgi:hypothetical protein